VRKKSLDRGVSDYFTRGPAPDPRAKNWTADEKRRATDVVDCFKQVQRKLRELSIEATDGRTGT
jgi:hypothetical protein